MLAKQGLTSGIYAIVLVGMRRHLPMGPSEESIRQETVKNQRRDEELCTIRTTSGQHVGSD